MRHKSIFKVVPIINVLVVLLLLSAFVSLFYNEVLFAIQLIIAVAAGVFSVIQMLSLQRRIHEYFGAITKELSVGGSDSLSQFTVPLMVVSESGSVVWYNDFFQKIVADGAEVYGEKESFIFDKKALENLSTVGKAEISYNNRNYGVFSYTADHDGNKQKVYFFYDHSNLVALAKKYRSSRPVVCFITIDSLDILLKNAMESEKAAITGAIEREIETLLQGTEGFFQKLSGEKYVLIVEEHNLEIIINNKFEVLSKVRSLNFDERGSTTLSIGVGHGGDTIGECVNMASQALDMALGRGGDQAVVKTADQFEFYGGISQGTTKTSRVKTRVIAATLTKLIDSSDNVLLMGHKFSDMDSFGAAFGLWKAITGMGKPARIVLDHTRSLAMPMVKRLAQAKIENVLIRPEEAVDVIGKKTLLIIVDIHRPSFLESPQLYEKAETVVVIDHHRKTVDYIQNALIFYHDPAASSACEMVSELLQYINPGLIGRLEAEALLAGIMLDTRNFVLRTGSKTFEASAYLRGRGADPVEVKKLFSDSIDIYRARSLVVSGAEIQNGFAISACNEENCEMRLIASEAADELLSINGVKASFVLFAGAGMINISARSLGEINVQLIMEILGGGGHQTMAAAQLQGITLEEAKNRLLSAIEEFNTQVRKG